jgi:hypothetical protein
VVEDIECVGTELQSGFVNVKLEALEERHIELVKARASNGYSSSLSIGESAGLIDVDQVG